MISHKINELNNFISGWYLEDKDICDKLIQYHASSSEKFAGMIGTGVDKTVKDSTDVILDLDHLVTYGNNLQSVVNEYIKKYPYSNYYAGFGIRENILVQHYRPTEGYHAWHTERTCAHSINATRHLAFLTYLNDVTDAGETEFFHQGIKVKPEKGLTLIFPADWTFTHRGVASPTQDKYITTGWFNFVN
jgi:hypothetical protein